MTPLEQVQAAVDHLKHVLPGQGPILDFVHENTLEGFQHLPFSEALDAYEKMTGVRGYMPEARFRKAHASGRITVADIDRAFGKMPLNPDAEIATTGMRTLTHRDIFLAALRHPFDALNPARLRWQLCHEDMLERFQPDVPETAQASMLSANADARAVLTGLWEHVLATLDIEFRQENPDESPDPDAVTENALEAAAREAVGSLLSQLGDRLSLGGLVAAVSGRDILDEVGPVMRRLAASVLDEGTAAWHLGDHHHASLYQAWKEGLGADRGLAMAGLKAENLLDDMPDDAWDAILRQLEALQLPREQWDGYLQRLCLEFPGWTGLINWRQQHPGYHSPNPLQPHLSDWLAIRLTLDKLYLDRLCREEFQCDATVSGVTGFLASHAVQAWVCLQWRQRLLPESLGHRVAALRRQAAASPEDWHALGRQCLARDHADGSLTAHEHAWKLFRLCQHLGIGESELAVLDRQVLTTMLGVLEDFDLRTRSQVWLLAYETHYREDLFRGIVANFRRGRWMDHSARPEAQIVMCMDEREESFRRHLEERNPRIETLGAAGFFGVPINYKAIDDTHHTPLCPVVVTPAHRVEETARAANDSSEAAHRKGHAILFRFAYQLHQGFRLNPLLNWLGTFLLAPLTLAGQLMHSLVPGTYKAIVDRIRGHFLIPVATALTVTTDTPDEPATTDNPRLGFTDEEQAQKTGTLLRTLGLTHNFAPLVVLSGHGSTSQNNPHEAAHDCGACGGRQGGPNARAYAAMVNRPAVRKLLAGEGIDIPDDTWFIGSQHDTCHDGMIWYDTDLVPAALQEKFRRFREDIAATQAMSAHERCRRFHSAGHPANPPAAFRHVTLRARDLSQVRPEYGHATNASAVIGRRYLTQGLFLDRRSFLISYDPTQDPEGNILENILLTAGPVGAGINLEYYFSTIDNDNFGCGTKIPHNVAGMFGVMEGTASDLRPGLPEQMIEIHEPMRLLVLVEHKTSVVERIYGDQPALQELIGGGWLLVAAKDPDTEDIFVFEPGTGFVQWQGSEQELSEFDRSPECYRGIDTPIAPALIRRPQLEETA